MTDTHERYLEMIRRTRRCQSEVLETAGKMAEAEKGDVEKLARMLIEKGEDTALGILMNVCAVREIKLSPELLPEILEVIEPIIDFGPLLRVQDGDAVPFLLEAAANEAVSSERQAYAGMLAAEMSIAFARDLAPVRRLLNILNRSYSTSMEAKGLLMGALTLIDMPEEKAVSERFLFREEILKLLPKDPPPIVIGDGGTVRRPVPKVGRNEPCPCGSGKKYKKCCMGKDQQRIRDASSYEGFTRSQVLESPDLVDDDAMIQEMRSYELKKLDPDRLNSSQLLAACRRCDLFGLRELAFGMLLELEKRTGEDNDIFFDNGHFIDLLDSALNAGDVELAEKISERIPWDEEEELLATIRIHFELLRHPNLIGAMEARLREEMSEPRDFFPDSLLIQLGYGFEKICPALSIVFARAFISGHPDRYVDNETMLDTIRRARAELNTDFWDDPIEDYMEWCMDRDMEDFKEQKSSEELNDLSEKLETAREEIRKGERELREKEQQLKTAAEKLKEQDSLLSRRKPAEKQATQPSTEADRGTIARLRTRIESLKAEIGSHQQVRRDLRKELREEREKSLKQRRGDAESADAPPAPAGLEPPKNIKKILIPEFLPAFHRSCAVMPTVHAANALKSVSGFSAGDAVVWRRTKPIQRIPGCYRIRIGRDYRLLLDWKPEETLRVLDCIPRSDLESWIHRRVSA